MKETFLNIKNKLSKTFTSNEGIPDEEKAEEYVTVGAESADKSKVVVKTYLLEDFSDIKPILDDLREGYTVALVNIRPLKDKDLIELKRAVNKLKKTCDAVEGDIAGFGEDYIVAAPSFAKIERTAQTSKIKAEEEAQ